MERNRISRSAVHNEAKGGRLRLRHYGRRVLIALEDEATWREAVIR
jgi:hypothetical protein